MICHSDRTQSILGCNDLDLSYELLRARKLSALANRRKFLRLMCFYKAINGHIIFPDNTIITCHCSHNARSSGQITYHQPLAHSNMYHYSL